MNFFRLKSDKNSAQRNKKEKRIKKRARNKMIRKGQKEYEVKGNLRALDIRKCSFFLKVNMFIMKPDLRFQ